jgi:gas vesicle protein
MSCSIDLNLERDTFKRLEREFGREVATQCFAASIAHYNIEGLMQIRAGMVTYTRTDNDLVCDTFGWKQMHTGQIELPELTREAALRAAELARQGQTAMYLGEEHGSKKISINILIPDPNSDKVFAHVLYLEKDGPAAKHQMEQLEKILGKIPPEGQVATRPVSATHIDQAIEAVTDGEFKSQKELNEKVRDEIAAVTEAIKNRGIDNYIQDLSASYSKESSDLLKSVRTSFESNPEGTFTQAAWSDLSPGRLGVALALRDAIVSQGGLDSFRANDRVSSSALVSAQDEKPISREVAASSAPFVSPASQFAASFALGEPTLMLHSAGSPLPKTIEAPELSERQGRAPHVVGSETTYEERVSAKESARTAQSRLDGSEADTQRERTESALLSALLKSQAEERRLLQRLEKRVERDPAAAPRADSAQPQIGIDARSLFPLSNNLSSKSEGLRATGLDLSVVASSLKQSREQSPWAEKVDSSSLYSSAWSSGDRASRRNSAAPLSPELLLLSRNQRVSASSVSRATSQARMNAPRTFIGPGSSAEFSRRARLNLSLGLRRSIADASALRTQALRAEISRIRSSLRAFREAALSISGDVKSSQLSDLSARLMKRLNSLLSNGLRRFEDMRDKVAERVRDVFAGRLFTGKATPIDGLLAALQKSLRSPQVLSRHPELIPSLQEIRRLRFALKYPAEMLFDKALEILPRSARERLIEILSVRVARSLRALDRARGDTAFSREAYQTALVATLSRLALLRRALLSLGRRDEAKKLSAFMLQLLEELYALGLSASELQQGALAETDWVLARAGNLRSRRQRRRAGGAELNDAAEAGIGSIEATLSTKRASVRAGQRAYLRSSPQSVEKEPMAAPFQAPAVSGPKDFLETNQSVQKISDDSLSNAL